MKKIAILWIILLFSSISLNWYSYTNDMLDAANSLASKWIINDHKGNPSLYNLDSKVLRQEIAAVSRWVAWIDKSTTCKNIFSDVSSTKPNSWICYNVEPLVENSLISKNDKFRPEDYITKTEALGMLIKSIWFDYKYNSDDSRGWQEQIVSYAVNKWIVDNFTDYNTEATRWWVFEVADFSMEVKEIEEKQKWPYSDEL